MITVSLHDGGLVTFVSLLINVSVLGYLLMLRIDTGRLADVSNWCLSQKAKLEAGRAAFNRKRVRTTNKPAVIQTRQTLPVGESTNPDSQ